jgi:hypothetical protein
MTAPPVSLSELLGVDVLVGTVRVGEVSAVFVDESGLRAIGVEVAGAGGARRFLPWVAARMAPDTVSVDSALFLVDDGESYERRGARAVRDRHELAGLVAGADGAIVPSDAVSRQLATGSST